MKQIRTSIDMYKKSFLNIFLFILFLWSLFSVSWNSELMHSGGKATMIQIIYSIFKPDFSYETIKLALTSSWITLAYAAAGMSIAFIIAFFLSILASGILFSEKGVAKNFLKAFFRGILGSMRAIHELVWAWLFVAAIGLSPYAAIFALAIPYGGTLGRIFADIFNDVQRHPINALKASGASKLQILFYGYLPMSISDMISYSMYRFECSVRSSTIMSFVGLGGLGYQIQLALSDLMYERVWTFIFFLIFLVTAIDCWSNALRKRLIK
ncbi:PhnE/PtxC family ABC transporter permease [Tepidibacter mesophilus]|uniref:PhnE/PtxC family ABC transporter permease n=1 Tax=Tepidibacter mesophilus TaxID=655607 RepID=UPI001FA8B1FC|nr:ABC transporter permease subunit [Tepidibacter mesophilus]